MHLAVSAWETEHSPFGMKEGKIVGVHCWLCKLLQLQPAQTKSWTQMQGWGGVGPVLGPNTLLEEGPCLNLNNHPSCNWTPHQTLAYECPRLWEAAEQSQEAMWSADQQTYNHRQNDCKEYLVFIGSQGTAGRLTHTSWYLARPSWHLQLD